MWLYSDHPEQLIQSIATSEGVGSLVYAASRFPVLLHMVSLLEKKSKGDSVRGKRGHCWQTGLILGCGELSRKHLLAQEFGDYLRSKKDGFFMRTLKCGICLFYMTLPVTAII